MLLQSYVSVLYLMYLPVHADRRIFESKVSTCTSCTNRSILRKRNKYYTIERAIIWVLRRSATRCLCCEYANLTCRSIHLLSFASSSSSGSGCFVRRAISSQKGEEDAIEKDCLGVAKLDYILLRNVKQDSSHSS